MEYPAAYLITFTTYGTWLHGDTRGSIDRMHNRYGDAFVESNSARQENERGALTNPPVTLSPEEQELVLNALKSVCDSRGWTAHALHVRTNHVHIVVSGSAKPKKMMVDFKAYATRALRQCSGPQADGIKHWTQHGSTKYLWTKQSVEAAVRYVRDGQGKMMAFDATCEQSRERK